LLSNKSSVTRILDLGSDIGFAAASFLSEYSKEVVLNLFDSLKGSQAFGVSENLESNNSLQTMNSITINGILGKVGWDSIDIIKIDIEGAEFELLQENIEWIQKTKYLIIETHDWFKKGSTKQLFKSLEPFNYMVQIINKNFFIKSYEEN
jgi:hypothetical protein